MRALLVTIAGLLCVQQQALTVTAQPAGTACTTPRIRKPWEAYSQADKDLYVKAVGLAMQRGFHQKFVELHTEANSEAEAHRNCLFMYWHRMFLLGYENMLRSLGPEYACVTLPYWDHLSATARAASGKCSSIEECSPIYTGLGGSTTGIDIDLRIYSTNIPDTTATKCVTAEPLSHFCGNNTRCAGCVTRGSVSTTQYPAEATFPSVYQQVFTYSDWPRFALSIERGVHST
jgi:tyrosinase